MNFLSFRATSTLSSRIVNEFHAGSAVCSGPQLCLRGNAKARPCCRSRMASVIGPTSPAVSRVCFALGAPVGGFPSGSISRLNVFGDNISWVSGRHTFKFGGEVRFGSGDDAFVDIGVTPAAMFGRGGGPQQ